MYLKYSTVRDVAAPVRANPFDAIDLFVPNDTTPFMLHPGENVAIPSGIKFEVPVGTALVVMNKSGIAVKKSLIKGAELIDHGYAGEVHIDLHNIGNDDVSIKPGDKIIQLLHIPVLTPTLMEVDEGELYADILCVSSRGTGALGSTGTTAES